MQRSAPVGRGSWVGFRARPRYLLRCRRTLSFSRSAVLLSPFLCMLIHRCNMECRNYHITNRLVPDMDIDWMVQALRRLPRRTQIRIAGAEATVRKDLPDITRRVRGYRGGCREIVCLSDRCVSTRLWTVRHGAVRAWTLFTRRCAAPFTESRLFPSFSGPWTRHGTSSIFNSEDSKPGRTSGRGDRNPGMRLAKHAWPERGRASNIRLH